MSGVEAFVVRYWTGADNPPTRCVFVGHRERPEAVEAAAGATVFDTPIFPDDRRDVALRKIVHELVASGMVKRGSVPVAWRKGAMLTFATPAPRPLPANPFSAGAVAGAGAVASPVRTSLESEWIGRAPLDITFVHHLPPALAARPAVDYYVFGDDRGAGKTMAQIRQDDAVLEGLLALAPVRPTVVGKLLQVEWSADLRAGAGLGELFARMHTSDAMPFIQWVDDRQHVLYKLRKTHPFTVDELAALMDYQRLSKTSVVVAVFRMPGHYVRLSVNAAGHVQARARPATTDRAYLDTAAAAMSAALSSAAGRRAALTVAAITSKIHIKTAVDIATLTRHLSRYTSIAQVRKAAGGGIYVQWLRASNYRANVDVVEVVRHRIQLGVDVAAVVDDLVEYNGYSVAEAQAIVEASEGTGAEAAVGQAPKAGMATAATAYQSIIGAGMLLHIVSVKGTQRGIDCQFMNAAGEADVHQCLQWLTAILAQAPSAAASAPGKRAAAAQSPEAPALPEVVLEEDPFALSASSSSSASSAGGAGLNFIKDLQRADPDIFNKNYTKKCQSASNSQPMVLTRAEFDALPPEARGALDNHVVYGSDPDPSKHHVYFCPAVWCAKSKTPMSHDQYVANGNKCADGSEGAQVWDNDYWGHNARGKRYIGFTAKSVEAPAPCLPCCYIHPPKKPAVDKCMAKVNGKAAAPAPAQEDAPAPPPRPASPASPAAPADTYLLTHAPPLPSDRWGVIPQALHVVLHRADLPYNQCKSQYNSRPCIVRRGILHHADSLMQALGYLVFGEINSKAALVARIREALGADAFVCLANGRVLQAFAPVAAIVPERAPALRREWAAWIAAQPRYTRMFPGAAAATGLRLSRELAIYTAYKRFFQYLASTEEKDVEMVVDVVRHLGLRLVVWEKGADDLVHLRCSGAGAVPAAGAPNPVAMLFHENGYYEPLEIKMRNKRGATQLAAAEAGQLPALLQKCPAVGREWPETVRLLRAIMTTALAFPEAFLWDRLVVSPDLDVVGILTAGNVYVDVGRMPLSAAADVGLPCVFAEDLAGQRLRVRVGGGDMRVFAGVLATWGARVHGSEALEATAGGMVQMAYALPPSALAGAPALLTATERTDVDYGEPLRRADAERRRWASARWMVGKALLRHYDAWGVAGAGAADGAEALIARFPAKTHDLVAEVLVEVPLRSREALAAWLGHVTTSALPFLSPNIQESTRYAEVVFSQVAVERGLPRHILVPAKAPRPRDVAAPTFRAAWKSLLVERKWPAFLPKTAGAKGFERLALPWKWAETRKYSWRDFPVWHSEAAQTGIPAFWEWLAARFQVPLTWKMVALAYKTYVANVVFADADLLAEYAAQPAVCEALGAATKAAAVKRLAAMGQDARMDLLEAPMRAHDLLWFFAAKLAGVTVLIVSNVDYTRDDHLAGLECVDYKPTEARESQAEPGACKIKKAVTQVAAPAKVPRGSTMDLLTNAMLLCGAELEYERPFVMVYKHVEKEGATVREVYCPIEVAPGRFHFDQLRDAAVDLQNVVCCLWAHRAHRRTRPTAERMFA